jgi:carboxyl-terminal processing protease
MSQPEMPNRVKALILSFSMMLALFAVAGGLNVHAASGKSDGAYKEIGVYSEVLSRIHSEYVEEPNMTQVTDGALHGLLESLDSNSSYLTPEEYKQYKTHKKAGRGTIGATVSKRFGYADVVSVLPGGPAAKAAIEDGDIIEAINSKSTREISLAEIHEMLNGDPGSTVTLAVVRARRAKPEEIVLTRAVVNVPPASGKVLEATVGYVKPYALEKGAAEGVASKIRDLEREGAKKLVFDLRDVSKGDPQEGVAVANLFLDHGLIAYLAGQKYTRVDYNADPTKAVTRLPLVVLVNNGTSGAAEIVAAAILDNARGDVLGDKTFGDGSVQKLIEIPDGSALILSVAKYFTPAGKALQDEGVTPNIVVTSENLEDEGPPAQPQQDEQLQRAVEVLKNRPS